MPAEAVHIEQRPRLQQLLLVHNGQAQAECKELTEPASVEPMKVVDDLEDRCAYMEADLKRCNTVAQQIAQQRLLQLGGLSKIVEDCVSKGLQDRKDMVEMIGVVERKVETLTTLVGSYKAEMQQHFDDYPRRPLEADVPTTTTTTSGASVAPALKSPPTSPRSLAEYGVWLDGGHFAGLQRDRHTWRSRNVPPDPGPQGGPQVDGKQT